MAGHHLIENHLAALGATLPADTVDELADGLAETWQHHLATGLTPTEAAHAAIAEFGTPEQITRVFVAQAPGRRTARLLLATGPIIGISWAATLITAHAWTWPVPPAAKALTGLALLSSVAVLLAAATSRRSYRRTRLGIAGGLGVAIIDTAVIAATLLAAPALVWPMAVAIPASLTRSALVMRSLSRGQPAGRRVVPVGGPAAPTCRRCSHRGSGTHACWPAWMPGRAGSISAVWLP